MKPTLTIVDVIGAAGDFLIRCQALPRDEQIGRVGIRLGKWPLVESAKPDVFQILMGMR